MVKEFLLVRRATPAPKEHFLGNDLMATLILLNHVATAEEEQCGLLCDLLGADHGGSGGSLVLTGQRVCHDDLAKLFDETVVPPKVVVTLGRGRLEAHLHEATRWQKINELGRKIAYHDPVAFAFLRNLHAK